jgi:hypothetical protein
MECPRDFRGINTPRPYWGRSLWLLKGHKVTLRLKCLLHGVLGAAQVQGGLGARQQATLGRRLWPLRGHLFHHLLTNSVHGDLHKLFWCFQHIWLSS